MRATYAINGQSLDALCADNAVLSQLNRGMDQLRLILAKDPGWTYGQSITVTRNGSTFWTGHVTITARNFQRNDRWEIVIKNGWHDLAERTYENKLKHWNIETRDVHSESIYVPEAMLGQDETGAHIRTGAQIADIVAFSQSKGDSISAGSILTGVLPPQSYAADISCLQAIQKMMVYHPDASAWIDGTALHVQPASALATVALDPATDDLESWPIVERPDLKPKGLKIVWKKAITQDGVSRMTYETHTRGDLSGKPAAVVFTIELAGANANYEHVQIDTRSIPESDQLDIAWAKNFYRSLLPWLANADLDDLEIRGQRIAIVNQVRDELDEDTGEVAADGENALGTPAEILSKTDAEIYADYPRQLVSGTVYDWMGAEAWPARLQARVYYKGLDAAIVRKMGGARSYSAEAGAFYSSYDVDVIITVTDALPKDYSRIESSDPGGEPLDELIGDYWAAINRTRFEGQLAGPLWANTKLATLKPGKKLRIAGATSEAMPVESATFDLIADKGTWTFGVPDHLSLGDLHDLNQVGNTNPPSWHRPEQRTDAESGVGARSVDRRADPHRATTADAAGRGADDWWGIDLQPRSADTDPVKWRLKPGTIKLSSSYAADGAQEIDGIDAEKSAPNDGQVAYLEFVFDGDGALESTALSVGDRWEEFPEAYQLETDEDGALRMRKFFWLLHSFHAPNASRMAGSEPIGEVVAKRIAARVECFKLIDVAMVDEASGRRFRGVDLVASHGVVFA